MLLLVVAMRRMLVRPGTEWQEPYRRRGSGCYHGAERRRSRSKEFRMKRHRRRASTGVIRSLSLAIGIWLAAGASGAAQETVVGVNAFPNAKALPLHAGIAKGIFAKRGLRLALELTEGATAQRQNFAAGKFQIVHSA